jgi:DNA repair photolyase
MSKKIIEIPKFAEAQRCFYPVRADCYYSGCGHNCIYCYSRAVNSRFKQWDINNVKNVDIKDLELLFIKAFQKNNNDKVSNIIRNRIPLRLGGITDLFQPCEVDREITLELIKILNKYNYPYLIVTKSALVSEEKYLRIIRKDLAYVQITITTLNEEYAKILEPNASTIKERLECMDKMIKKGIYTAARVSPLIPLYEDGYFSKNIDNTSPLFDFFSFELIKELCNKKPNTIIIEFLRVSPIIRKILLENKMSKILDLYNEKSVKGRDGSLHFSLEEKEFYCKEISAICSENNIDFSICEDKEYEYFKKYWANKEDCCNALNNIFKDNIRTLNQSADKL